MLFNSWEFLILCLSTLGLYYLPVRLLSGKVWQITLLLTASAIFYAWEEPRLLILLSVSCMLNAVAVERILFWKKDQSSGGGGQEWGGVRAKRWLTWTVALNLGFLTFFKYAGFLSGLVPDTLFPGFWKLWLTGVPLPVGISFYTFQGISLVVDVWRNDISEETRDRLAGRGAGRLTSVRDTSFYIAFFPQLVAGPIVKAHEFVDQIGAKRLADIDWITVRRSLILGYFLKIFVADNLAEQTAFLSVGGAGLAAVSPFNTVPLLYGYGLQIFADFGGYSLIAIGLGALFGYKLPQNFNFPYLSTSITEFWRRWHLSLSAWLRDYLYIPLGGNRKSSGRTYFNLFLVMFLGGLWHGAAWKFALWGSLHGIFLALDRLGGSVFREGCVSVNRKERKNPCATTDPCVFLIPKHRFTDTLKHLCSWFLTFHIVTALWLTFMMPDMASIEAFFKGLCNGNPWFEGPPIFSLLFYGTAVVLYHAWGWLREHHDDLAVKLARSPLEPLIHGVMIFLVLTNPGAPRGFIYFQF